VTADFGLKKKVRNDELEVGGERTSSLTPPNEILPNGLPSALAIDWPRDVFPVPGGPTNLQMSVREWDEMGGREGNGQEDGAFGRFVSGG
jgi:hypothetical protein